MSAAGGILGRFVSTLGGPQAATAVLVGGLVVGAVSGGAIAGGAFSGRSASSNGELPVWPCPNEGPPWLLVKQGQHILVTGRTGDGKYARIHVPLPGRTEGWVETTMLTMDKSLSSVPVATCAPETAAAAPSVEPGPTLTAVENNSPSPTPEQSLAPNKAPTLASLSVKPSTIAGGPERYCPSTPRSVSFSVKATDSDGIAGATLFFREPGASGYASKPMTSAGADTWQVTLDTDADAITGSGSLRYYIVATDANAGPRTGRMPGSGTKTLNVASCANAGPVLASLKASPSTVYTNLGACKGNPDTTTISVSATDVDGVTGVDLFYRLPGDGSFRKQAMSSNGNTWSTKVKPVDQRPNANGKTSYYVVATDKTGKTTKSGTQTFKVQRCDYEATFFVNSVGTSYSYCPGRTSSVNFVWNFSITDPDGLTSATLSYRVVNADTGAKTSGSKSVKVTDQRFSISSSAIDGSTFFGANSVTWTITTTDKYGGKSSASNKATVTIFVC